MNPVAEFVALVGVMTPVFLVALIFVATFEPLNILAALVAFVVAIILALLPPSRRRGRACGRGCDDCQIELPRRQSFCPWVCSEGTISKEI